MGLRPRLHAVAASRLKNVQLQKASARGIDDRPALTIPAAALQRVAGEEVVFVRGADRTFAVRRVRVGARTAATVEIQSGLREGEEVVADGSLTLKAELERSSFADEDD